MSSVSILQSLSSISQFCVLTFARPLSSSLTYVPLQGTLNSGNVNYNPTMFQLQQTSGFYPPGTSAPSYTQNGVPALIEATGSVYGDHLFVFGGWTSASTQSSDLWVYTFPTSTWFMVPRSSPWPAFPASMTFPGPAGVTIGRHFYIAMPAAGGSGFVQMWRWTFNPFFQPPGPTVEPIPAGWHTGTTAGLVIACLLNVATLGFVFTQWRKAGGTFSVPSVGGGGGSGGYVPSSYPPGLAPSDSATPYAGMTDA